MFRLHGSRFHEFYMNFKMEKCSTYNSGAILWQVVLCALIFTFNLRAFAADVNPEITKRMIALLQPYVAPLERDLWTFRYERIDNFHPKNQAEVQNRISSWADRFFNSDIINGADTGPGVYVAMDPVATATWGQAEPRLYAIKINKGTRVLIGDQYHLPEDILQSLKKISSELGCGNSSTEMDDMGHVVGFFRMNENRVCRSLIVDVIRSLDVRAISYSFNSVSIKDCRPTGTAISIVDSRAISLQEINAYSAAGNIEGQAAVTPFVRKLFDEGKNDFYAQSLLASMSALKSFRKDYGFFDHSNEVDKVTYQKWKAEHILKCGPLWNIETPNPKARDIMRERQKADPQVADLLIRMSVTYADRFARSFGKMTIDQSQTLAQEFNILNLKAIKERHPGPVNIENMMRFYTAQVPNWTGDYDKDRTKYFEILNDCWALYSDESKDFIQIIQGECGVEREK